MFRGTRTKLEQNSQFVVNWVHFRQNDDIMFSSMKMKEYMESELLGIIGRQKYSAWVLGDPLFAYES